MIEWISSRPLVALAVDVLLIGFVLFSVLFGMLKLSNYENRYINQPR